MGFLDRILPPGKMRIELEKLEFHPGESVKGKVVLDMKKPMSAKDLTVRVVGQEIIKQRRMTSKGSTIDTDTHTIFKFEKVLGSEQEYVSTSYDFDIAIPQNMLDSNTPQLEGAAATAVAAVSMLAGRSSSRKVEWFVEGKLDIPGGRDIAKRVKINVA